MRELSERARARRICALGFGLRVVGLQYGLPAVYNPDEVAIMARALSFAKGTLNPHNFLYPTFYFYVLFGWVGVYLALVWLTGRVASHRSAPASSTSPIRQASTPPDASRRRCGHGDHRAASIASAARCSIAARRSRRRVFLAVAPLARSRLALRQARLPATLAIVVAYLAIVRVWPCAAQRGTAAPRRLVAGAACGVAFSTHYYCIFLALPLTLAIIQGWRTHGLPRRGCGSCSSPAARARVVFFALVAVPRSSSR